MQKPAAQQKTVLETILDWSKDRPLWQRDALRRIIANGRLTDADIGELVDLCKQGKGAPVGALKAVPLEKAHLPANPGQTAAVSLLSIADVTGVNNLAAGQTSRSKRQAMSSLPHARGGVSIHLAPQQLHFGSSPSPGGCLSIHRALFLIASALPECIWCFPRIDLHVYYQACSPA